MNLSTWYKILTFQRFCWSEKFLKTSKAVKKSLNQTIKNSNSVSSTKQRKNSTNQSSVCTSWTTTNIITKYWNVWQSHRQIKRWASLFKHFNLQCQFCHSLENYSSFFRNAIKAHRFLYLKKNILHKNISKNNIIITHSNKINDFAEMLIDLNFAKMIDSERSDAQHQTNTIKFMIVEMLFDIDHTYWHDLKSFFYVLIWFCVRREWKFCENLQNRPKKNVLTKWYSGSFKDIAKTKKMICILIDLKIPWMNFQQPLIPSSLCAEKYKKYFFFFWKTECFLKKPHRIHLKNYMTLSLNRLITL